ncbi:MAG: hypothetical protein CHACPFDD_02146 [Phycisphaerae bacterium]|nr:hypothetical protein [Phycisphaerae bacterium]
MEGFDLSVRVDLAHDVPSPPRVSNRPHTARPRLEPRTLTPEPSTYPHTIHPSSCRIANSSLRGTTRTA